MRTYKFRGKRIDNGEWVYGGIVIRLDGKEQHIAYFDESMLSWRNVPVDPETVAQFTGLKDKFGTEIYENHIVKQSYHAQTGHIHDGSDIDYTGHHIGRVVIVSSKGVCMKNPLCYSDETDETTITNQYKNVSGKRCEVIGDIHSNSDLLEVKA